jgi:hypothetical protein
MSMHCAYAIQHRVRSVAVVKPVTRTQVPRPRSTAQVMKCTETGDVQNVSVWILCIVTSDSCKVNNGGCDRNADCTHNTTTFAVKCICKTGYVNTGCVCNAFCIGEQSIDALF